MDEAEVMRRNDGLVHLIIHRMRRRWPCFRRIPRADLFQTGRIGMLKAIRAYDSSSSKFKWSTYLSNRIKWEILADYGRRFQRDPLTNAYPVRDIIDPRDFNEEITIQDEQDEVCRIIRQALLELNEKPVRPYLNPEGNVRVVTAISLRYGIGTDEHKLIDIGRILGVTKERARQITDHGLIILAKTRALAQYQTDIEQHEQARYLTAMKRRTIAERLTMRLIGPRAESE